MNWHNIHVYIILFVGKDAVPSTQGNCQLVHLHLLHPDLHRLIHILFLFFPSISPWSFDFSFFCPSDFLWNFIRVCAQPVRCLFWCLNIIQITSAASRCQGRWWNPRSCLTESAIDLLVSLSPPTLVIIVVLEFFFYFWNKSWVCYII